MQHGRTSNIGSHSDLKQNDEAVSAYDEHLSSLQLDDENTTTKKRQGQHKATIYRTGSGSGGYQELLSVPTKQAHLAIMQSPLATYLQRANIGTSASYHQAISVLSDFKDSNDQTRTAQRVLQSPPEFTSPLDSNIAKQHYGACGLEPILESSILGSTSHLAATHSNLNNASQKLSHLGMPPIKTQAISQVQQNGNTGCDSANKLSFSRFYELNVSPRNTRSAQSISHLHSHLQQQLQYAANKNSQLETIAKPVNAAGSAYSSAVRPFTTLSNGQMYRHSAGKVSKSDAEMAACEQMMEQIAALIDYDVSDYLPATSRQNFERTPSGTATKSSMKQRVRPLTNNFMSVATQAADNNSFISRSSRFSSKRKAGSKTPQNQKYLPPFRQQNHRHSQSRASQSMMTVEVEDTYEPVVDHESQCSEGSSDTSAAQQSVSCCSHQHGGSKRHPQRRRDRSRHHQHCMELSFDEDLANAEDRPLHSCKHQQQNKRTRGNKCQGRAKGSCYGGKANRSYYEGQNDGGNSSLERDQHCISTSHYDTKMENSHPNNNHNASINSNCFSSAHHNQFKQSCFDSSERQRLALMILQGDQSVQIVQRQPEDSQGATASPSFQILPSTSQSEDQGNKALKFQKMHQTVKTSDFNQLVGNNSNMRRPQTSRNMMPQETSEQLHNQHILINNGCSGSSPSRISHSRYQSADHQIVQQQKQQDAGGSYDFIQLTQINSAAADLSQQSNTINEIQQALIQPNDCVQTSFSHLYQPYSQQQKSDTPAELTIQHQDSFAASKPDEKVEEKAKAKRRKLSLMESVVLIQQTYRRVWKQKKLQSVVDKNKMIEEHPILVIAQQISDQKEDQQVAEPPLPELLTTTTAEPELIKQEKSEGRKSLKSTACGESSDIEIPVMFEYDNWWLDAEKPMTDECLAAFLKKHF